MKNAIKGLSQAFLMIIAILGFTYANTDANDGAGQVRLVKKVNPSGDLDIVLESESDNPNAKCKVSIFNMSSYKEAYQWFANAYEAVAFIRDGHAAGKLYESYMRVCRDNGPFAYEVQNYYAMCTAVNLTKFLKVEAINSSDAIAQIEPQLIELLGLNPEDDNKVKIDVKIMNETEARAFAGFVIQS